LHGESARLAAEAWNGQRVDPSQTPARAGVRPLPSLGDDALIAPDIKWAPLAGEADNAPAPGYSQTSEFMIGRVAIGVILPESNGRVDASNHNWDSSRENKVISEIVSGISWLQDHPHAPGDLTFIYNVYRRVPTGYEPAVHSQEEEGLWIGETLAALGYGSGDYFKRARDFNNALRHLNRTD
jgi:hypothetical protein